MKYKIFSLLMVLFLVFIIVTPVFADDPPGYSQMKDITNVGGTTKLVRAGNKILGVVYAVGVVVSIGTLCIIGIKYMMSSPSEKADLKSKAMPFVIGAIIMFCAANILQVVNKMAEWIN